MSSEKNAESSKQGKKRARKQEMAARAAVMEEEKLSQGVRIGGGEGVEGSNTSHSSVAPNATKKKKQGRGRSQLKIDGKVKQVLFNERSDPVGPGSDKLASFLGQLVRKHVLLCKGWRKVDKRVKESLWEMVKQNFAPDEIHRKKNLSKMAKLRRDYKYELTDALRQYIEAKSKKSENEGNIEGAEPLDLFSIKPPHIDDDDWMNFVADRTSEEFKVISEIQKAIREEQEYVELSSRRGFALLEYDMKQTVEDPRTVTRDVVWVGGHTKKGIPKSPVVANIMEKMAEYSKTPAGQSSTGIHDDALAHVLGPERPGRVRRMGFGATPSQVNALLASSVANSAIVNELRDLRQQVTGMNASREEELREVREFMAAQRAKSNGGRSHGSTIPTTMPSANSHGQPCAGMKCIPLNWCGNDEEEVAIATIADVDPTCKVHNVPLGRTCYKVWVDRVLNREDAPRVHLFRPTSEFCVLDEAIGSTVAWGIDFIRFLGQ